MSTITTRAGKGSPLTNNEVDANFVNLNNDKLESVSQSDVTQHQAALSITESQISDLDKYTQAEVDTLLSNLEAYDQSLNTTDAVAFASVQLTGGTGTQGTISWNTDEETLDVILDGATLQMGQEVHYHARNNTGSTIPDGTAVYATGTLGASGRITIAPYIADGSIPAKYFLGITTEAITNGTDGKVTQFGKIRGVDTSAFTEGAVLYPSATTAGALTSTAPTGSNVALPVAFVIYAAANGTLFTRSTNLDENAFATAAQGALADSALQSETDPVFTAWDKSTGISITESQISDFGSYQPAGSYITTATTFGGDVSGTYNAIVVADDSHNHIIANVDGLQAALDGKVDDSQVLTNVPAGAVFTDTTYSVGNGGLTEINFTSALNSKLAGIEAGATGDQTAAEILAAIKTVDGAGSGLDADLLDGQSSAYYATASHNHTLDGLSNTTITSNSAGEILKWNGTAWVNNTLAEAGIQPAGSYLTTATTFSGDVSGTYNAIVVADDSHNHVISNVDGLQTALDGKSATTHNHTLDGLSNTTITSNSAGEILKWNGTAWVNNTLAEAGIQPAGSYLTGNQTITLTGDASGSGTTSIAVTVNNDSHTHSTSTITGLGALATLSSVGAAQITDNSVGAAELNVSGNGTAGQALVSDGDGTFSWGSAGASAENLLITSTTYNYNYNGAGNGWATRTVQTNLAFNAGTYSFDDVMNCSGSIRIATTQDIGWSRNFANMNGQQVNHGNYGDYTKVGWNNGATLSANGILTVPNTTNLYEQSYNYYWDNFNMSVYMKNTYLIEV